MYSLGSHFGTFWDRILVLLGSHFSTFWDCMLVLLRCRSQFLGIAVFEIADCKLHYSTNDFPKGHGIMGPRQVPKITSTPQ